MNTTTTVPWQARLQKGSHYLRVFFLVLLISCLADLVLLGLGAIYSDHLNHFQRSWFPYWWGVTDTVECWLAYNVFACFARGEWFTLPAVRWLQAFGALSLLNGLVIFCNTLFRSPMGMFNLRHLQLIGNLTETYQNFVVPFPLHLFGAAQNLLSQLMHNFMLGCIILMIAWILDEGRKLREEQELTV